MSFAVLLAAGLSAGIERAEGNLTSSHTQPQRTRIAELLDPPQKEVVIDPSPAAKFVEDNAAFRALQRNQKTEVDAIENWYLEHFDDKDIGEQVLKKFEVLVKKTEKEQRGNFLALKQMITAYKGDGYQTKCSPQKWKNCSEYGLNNVAVTSNQETWLRDQWNKADKKLQEELSRQPKVIPMTPQPPPSVGPTDRHFPDLEKKYQPQSLNETWRDQSAAQRVYADAA